MAKKEEKRQIQCRNCRHAKLLQYGSNPIIAACTQGSHVADSYRYCSLYKQREANQTIKHLPP